MNKITYSELALNYDWVSRILSGGREGFWRRSLARRVKIISPPGRVLDVATGTGAQLLATGKIFPALEQIGLDRSPEMLRLAEKKLARIAPPQPSTILGDALDLPFPDEDFDSVTASFALRNMDFRLKLFREVLRVLKPGGRFLLLEMFNDLGSSVCGALTRLYLRKMVPFIGGRLLTRDYEAYRSLADSIITFPQPAQIIEELRATGFTALEYRVFTFNSVMLVWADKKTGLGLAQSGNRNQSGGEAQTILAGSQPSASN